MDRSGGLEILGSERRASASIWTRSTYFGGLKLLTLINDILDFSKIEAGKVDLEAVDFDLRDTVETWPLEDAGGSRPPTRVWICFAKSITKMFETP